MCAAPPRDLCDEDSVDLEDENLDGNENEIDLVSSCNGEVKLSFCICKPPEGFCIPSVDAVMKQFSLDKVGGIMIILPFNSTLKVQQANAHLKHGSISKLVFTLPITSPRSRNFPCSSVIESSSPGTVKIIERDKGFNIVEGLRCIFLPERATSKAGSNGASALTGSFSSSTAMVSRIGLTSPTYIKINYVTATDLKAENILLGLGYNRDCFAIWIQQAFCGSKDKSLRFWDCNSGECGVVVDFDGECGTLVNEGPWIFVGLDLRKNTVKQIDYCFSAFEREEGDNCGQEGEGNNIYQNLEQGSQTMEMVYILM
ncbi:hypothetical protein L2E82_14118 [Cichorium intybus]|uniref:Uncharacterized protein n=1 Tax=Cichorium intybus TaxID=13427 RepID=A0ACB9EZ72_CICIN|nr:hypothetical protein L2E82_14118 [Cichorium intybus]